MFARPYLPGVAHPLNVEYLKSVWTKTHINSFDYYICAARGPTVNDYEDFIAVLQATANFSVDGRQFRIWLGAPTILSSLSRSIRWNRF